MAQPSSLSPAEPLAHTVGPAWAPCPPSPLQALGRGLCSAGCRQPQVPYSLHFVFMFSGLGSFRFSSFLQRISHFVQCPLPKITLVLLSLRLLDFQTARSSMFHMKITTRYQSSLWWDSWFLPHKADHENCICFVFWLFLLRSLYF